MLRSMIGQQVWHACKQRRTSAHGEPEKVKRAERSSRDNRRRAAVPGRKDAAHGARRRGRNNLLHRRADADRRYHGRRRRLLGQELADGTLVAVGRMRGGNARPGADPRRGDGRETAQSQ